jgi:alginate O-acetyltransferase complex protein AlgI
MLFNSFHFLLFFVAVTLAYFLLPHRMRTLLLLAASVYFYMCFKAVYVLILAFTIVVDYFTGIWIESEPSLPRRRVLLALSIVANVGVLAVFKYYNFVAANLSGVAQLFGASARLPALSILLPIGLSFHTFQAMSYTIEVYRGRQKAERNFLVYSLYVMFYPQLVAGPIERPQNLLHQFYERHEFDPDRMAAGLRLMLWGFVKKLVIADRLGIFVDAVYNNPRRHNGVTLWVATLFFAVQIYCDFSGYTDIARGAAAVMGFRLMENFRRPYFSRSIREFWSRWHISLSTWFKDYVYIPLGGSRVPTRRWCFNILVVFALSGLWHGASWTYLLWGLLHAFYLISSVLVRRPRERVAGALGLTEHSALRAASAWAITMLLVCVSWVLFRADSVPSAAHVLGKMALPHGRLYIPSSANFIYALAGVALLVLAEFNEEFGPIKGPVLESEHVVVRYAASLSLVLLILVVGVFDGGQFIYFQF